MAATQQLQQVLISTEFVGHAVEPATVEKFKQLSNQHADLLTAFLHPNLADHDINDAPTGHASSFGEKTMATDDVVNNKVASQNMLFELKIRSSDGKLSDVETASSFEQQLLGKKDELNAQLRQNLKDGQKSISLFHQKNAKSMSDKEEWVSALGDDGQVGVYKLETGHDEFKYFLNVRIGQTQAAKELYKEVMKAKSLLTKKNSKNLATGDKTALTLMEFINGQQYKYVCSVNQRNARRIALKAAKILGVHVDSEVDKFAFVANRHIKKPQMAIPLISNESNILVAGKFRDAPCVFSFDNTVCVKRAFGGLILGQNPTMPLSVVFFDKNLETKTLKNSAHHSFPVSMGVQKSIEDLESVENKKSLFSAKELARIDERVTWEGKEDGTQQYNVRLSSKLHNTFDLSNTAQQAVLEQLHPSFSKNVKELRPVLLKISA